ncbi:MAG: hypothetical protein JNK79_16520 [Chitinophagaceae bacterium]|nr:hypothetical protein [Chitinophagaceae bacterium]
MKLKLVSIFSLVFFFSVILFTSCKKDDNSKTNNESEEVSTAVSDESLVTSELDAIALDAGTAIEYEGSFSGNNSVVEQIICDATVEFNASSDPMTITINYDGSNCGNGRSRTGSIVLSMVKGTEWKTEGASFTVTFNNLKITKTATNKSITITGTHTYTNVSGGLLVHLANEGPIIHTVTSEDMKISFDNGTARSWNIAKQRVYTYDNGAVLTISGLHTEGDELMVAEWGTNRAGISFTTSTVSPVVVKQSCNFRVTGGAVKHSTNGYSAIATFGLNANGESIDCPGSGSYYYKVVWAGRNGGSLSLILPY